MVSLVAKRWTRYGKDRIYVATQNGLQVGWFDLLDGSQCLDMVDQAEGFLEAIRPYLVAAGASEPTTPARVAPTLDAVPPAQVAPVWEDLACNQPGQGVRAEANTHLAEMKERSRVGTFLARALDVKTDERAFRVGAKGEEAVGPRLEKLVKDGWHVLHSVPVGKGKSDIDHVLIGRGGIYTVNTKNHPGKQVWVGQHVIKVGGHSTRYLPIARYEADRAQRLLEAAVGFEVPSKAVLVILTGTVIPQVTIKQMPDDVLVLDRTDVPGVFKKAPARLTADQVESLYDRARRSTTWR